VAAGVGSLDKVVVLSAQLAAAEARAGALDAQFAQVATATPGLLELDPKDETFAARASPALMTSQALCAPADIGMPSRSSSVSPSSQKSEP
jgi:hypothetical protein